MISRQGAQIANALNVPKMKMALPALNGSHHAEVDPSELETERVWATLPKALVIKIDDFHHQNRLRNRSVAVAKLIELALQSDWRKRSNA